MIPVLFLGIGALRRGVEAGGPIVQFRLTKPTSEAEIDWIPTTGVPGTSERRLLGTVLQRQDRVPGFPECGLP
jgi:hypothetical protein